MGEAKRRKATRAERMASHPCVYCAGSRPSGTVDHMPPRGVFDKKHRPPGLEFPCCHVCNDATRRADQVAALLSRIDHEDLPPERHAELQAHLQAVFNNHPGLLEELFAPSRSLIPPPPGSQSIFVGGPILSRYMDAFAAKFGFAMHAEIHGQALARSGGVAARWFSNAEIMQAKFPAGILELMGEPETLRQGRFEVSDQFGYQWRAQDGYGVYLGAFRRAFAIVAVSHYDFAFFENLGAPRVWRPGDFSEVSAADV